MFISGCYDKQSKNLICLYYVMSITYKLNFFIIIAPIYMYRGTPHLWGAYEGGFTTKMKKIFNYIFIDGLSGMAFGLFSTLILGTVMEQIGGLMPGTLGDMILVFAKIAKVMTGAGIGVGTAVKLQGSPLVAVSAAVAGMAGAFGNTLVTSTGSIITDSGIVFNGPGDPLGAFVAAIVAITVGRFLTGKLKGLEIILVPLFAIVAGSGIGLIIGDELSRMMQKIGSLINWATQQQPFVMGIVVSVVMGMVLTLPISSAALGIILNLSGLAAGAATVGCCCNMIGFAIASYKDNGVGGLIAQGLGTSMLQVPNIMKKPTIWLPAIVSSAILGPISTIVFKMTNTAAGCGMGTAGLVGTVTTYQNMTLVEDWKIVAIKIVLIQFILPAILASGISNYLKKHGFIKDGDMKLSI